MTAYNSLLRLCEQHEIPHEIRHTTRRDNGQPDRLTTVILNNAATIIFNSDGDYIGTASDVGIEDELAQDIDDMQYIRSVLDLYQLPYTVLALAPNPQGIGYAIHLMGAILHFDFNGILIHPMQINATIPFATMITQN